MPPPSSGAQRGKFSPALVVLWIALYVLLAGFLSFFLYRLPPTVERSPYLVFLLWLFFGILGVHRFFTQTPKVGLVYFFTLGGLGLGWLGDLYWQRGYLFSSTRRKKVRAIGTRAKNMFQNSTLAEKWKRNRQVLRSKLLKEKAGYQKTDGAEEEGEDSLQVAVEGSGEGEEREGGRGAS